MSFYSELTVVYERVFPVNSASVKFLSKNLKKDESIVLDVACGIGGHCLKLAPDCKKIYGVDYEDDMIAKAKRENSHENISYHVGDMLNMSNLFEIQFDSIYCIGNSLVHLPNRDKVSDFLKDAYKKLNSGGELIIQIINYDRIFGDNVKSLPTIENGEVVFSRDYDYKAGDDTVDFVTQLKINDTVYDNSIKLLALKTQELQNLLKEAGFDQNEFYCNFNEEEHSSKGYATVIRATKLK